MNYETNLAQELDLQEIIRVAIKNRRLILIIVSLAAIAAVVYSLLTPEIWSSETTFYALSDKKIDLSVSSSTMSKLISDLMDESAQNDAMISVNILSSRTISEEVIRRFDLISYFKLDDPDEMVNLDDALDKLPKLVEISYDDDNYLITIRVETKSKQLSREIAEFYLARLDEYLKHERMAKGRHKRIFLENRINELWAAMDSLQTAISDFKSEHRAVDLDLQAENLIAQYSELLAQKMKLEVDLVLAEENYPPDSPIVMAINKQIAETSRQITDMEKSPNPEAQMFRLDLARIPSLSAKLSKLQIQADVMAVVYDYVRPQYENAVLEEQKNMPRLEVVDHPREAGIRVRPRRALICIISTIVAFMAAVFLAIVKESITRPAMDARD